MLSRTIRRLVPGPLPLGLAIAANVVKSGYDAYQAIRSDPPFPTSTRSRTMPRSFNTSFKRSSYRRRMPMRSYRRAPKRDTGVKRLVRTSLIGTNTINLSASTFNSVIRNCVLSDVQTSDITAAYRLYRIAKVVVHLIPRVDAANSGVTNNYQLYVSAACDPEGTTAPSATTAITAYDNSYQKWVSSGDRFRYTFYPKVVNSVDLSGVSTAAGSYSSNPWLQLNSTGITIPHRQLVVGINAAAATTVLCDYYLEYHFDVKGLA